MTDEHEREDEAHDVAEEIEAEVETRNPDDTTKREAYEREVAERGLSDEAGHVGDET
ncbi:MAG TPA: hypothetical protein VM618_10730 [Acidimicrobiia bacterium]|nr:hypothetical protein [Acidimicrobiia bacterium]